MFKSKLKIEIIETAIIKNQKPLIKYVFSNNKKICT